MNKGNNKQLQQQQSKNTKELQRNENQEFTKNEIY